MVSYLSFDVSTIHAVVKIKANFFLGSNASDYKIVRAKLHRRPATQHCRTASVMLSHHNFLVTCIASPKYFDLVNFWILESPDLKVKFSSLEETFYFHLFSTTVTFCALLPLSLRFIQVSPLSLLRHTYDGIRGLALAF